MDFRELTEFIKDTIGYILGFTIILIIFIFVISFQPVAGNSMYPNLNEEDIVIVSKLFYKLGKPNRNDIVNVKDDLNKSYVKRVIGLPGEKIEYLDNILYINEKPYQENFIKEGINTSNFLFENICSLEECPNGVIPDDMYLLLGDNREESLDSRTPEFGLREKKYIKGQVVFKIYPFNEFGKV